MRVTACPKCARLLAPGAVCVCLDLRWQERAACRGRDVNLFFPVKGRPSTTTKPGKAVCKPCTVQEECLEYALARNERFGIFGGLTERERRALARERKAAA